MKTAGNQPLPAGPLSLDSKKLAPPKALPLSLEGRPRELFGRPVNYFTKEVVKAGEWTHRGTGEPYSIPVERMEEWNRNTKALLSAGVSPYLPNRHRSDVNNRDVDKERESIEQRKNFGRVIDVRREGESWYADIMLVGEDALDAIAADDVSITIMDGMLDAKGNRYGEALESLAIVPNPSQSNLGPFQRITAAADGVAREVPVFFLSANNPGVEPERSIIMKPETITKLRARFKFAADVPDDQVAEKAAEVALIDPPADKSAEVTALSADKTRLEGELSAAKQQVLSLSASVPKAPDPEIMRDRADNYSQRIDLMTERGDMPKFVADKLKARVLPTATLMLSASADFENKRPIDFVLSLFDGAKLGIQTGNPVQRFPAAPLALSGDNPDPNPAASLEAARKEAETWQAERTRGMQPVAAR